MNIVSFSIRRPVTVSMFYLGIILFGIISYSQLPQELFPSLSYPEISIFTHYGNASPQEVESLLTAHLEEAISTVSRLKRLKSISREGWSVIRASFIWGTDMDMASLYVREKIDLVRDRLPDGCDEPVVLKMNPFELPVMVVSLYLAQSKDCGYPKIDEEKGEIELTSFWKRRLKDELEKVEGVANSQVSGGITPEIEVAVESGDLWSKGLSIREIVETLEKTNYSYPAGFINDDYFEYLIRTVGEYRGLDEIKKTVVRRDRGLLLEDEAASERVVSLGDIARVEEVTKKRTSFSRYNGKPSLTIALKRQSGTNTMRISRALRKKVDSLKKGLPPDMRLSIIYDQSLLIREAVTGVRDAAVLGGLLSFLVLYLFMRERSSSILVASSILLSSMGGLLLIFLSGITLNIISLGGFALGIGMMVDNAIVVVENLSRSGKREFLREPDEIAGKIGEVGPAIFSSTFTTIAVFLPMVFAVGLAGQMIKELAMAITFCLLFSLLVAFTFIPCFWRKINTGDGYKSDRPGQMAVRYERMLRHFLKRKGAYLFLLSLVFGLSVVTLLNLRREFAPDTGEPVFYLDMQMPEGTPLRNTDDFAREAEEFLLSRKEIKEVTTTVGELEDREAKVGAFIGQHQARLMISLKDEYRKRRGEVIAGIKAYFKERGKGALTYKIIIPRQIAGAEVEDRGLAFEIKGYNLDEIEEVTRQARERLKKVNGIEEVRDNLAGHLPEKKITLDREKIAIYGLSVKEVAEAIQAAKVGVVATHLKRESGDIPVRIRLKEREEGNFLKDIFFVTPHKMRIPLGDVASVSSSLTSSGGQASEIHHIDQERAAVIGATFSPANKWHDRDFIKFLKEIPTGNVSLELAGERAMIKESFQSICLILLLAVVLIYMIMAAQFESLWQPFIIMFSLPAALIGVAFILWFREMSLNVISLLGMILLSGITVNNGIVLVSCIDQYRKEMSLEEAVVEGCVRRLRPVLMTALTTIVALLPLSLGIGKGAELRMPMATAVMGGLVTSTILTLFVIPALYIIGSRLIANQK